jgi:solute carrier family 9 (sodium/hydrogen exchanger), member 8
MFCLVGRAVNVFPIAFLINFARGNSEQLPVSHQVMMWFAGLRGAIAFTLSIDYFAVSKCQPDRNPEVIVTTTLIIVLITVLFLGGMTGKALQFLKISTGESVCAHILAGGNYTSSSHAFN